MIIIEYTIDHPLLRHTREHVPGVEIVWEDSNLGVNSQPQFLVWIESDGYEKLDEVLAEDSTVANPAMLAEKETGRMYRFEFTEKSVEFALEPEIVRSGGRVEDARATTEEWQVQARFPEREAVHRIVQFCRERDIDLTIERVFEQGNLNREDSPGMTAAQRETLLEAVDCGYLEIPRECSLAELGERLGVSESAASQRFRRGVRNLIQQTR